MPNVGASSWTPPRIGQHDVGQRQQADEIGVVLRGDQLDARMARQALGENVGDVGIGMQGKHDGDVLALEDGLQRVGDAENTGAEVLAAMAGDEDDAPVVVGEADAVPAGGEARVGIDDSPRCEKGVDHRVSGDVDPPVRHVLGPQRVRGPGRGREMLVGDGADDLAVHLLRPRRVDVAAAQAGLDMRHRDAPVVGSQRAGHGGGGVALDDHPARAHPVEDLADVLQQAGGELVERLVGPHDVEVDVGNDVGELQHLVQHLAVLGGGADLYGGGRLRLQPVDDRKQLDGFRARAHHHKEIILHG